MSATVTLTTSLPKTSDEVSADTECDLRVRKDEMCQHWARLHRFPPHLYFRGFKGELVKN